MRVGYGTSTERPVLQMNWQEVEAKIRSQVDVYKRQAFMYPEKRFCRTGGKNLKQH